MDKSAIISECCNYRYELRRIWDHSKPWVLFVCLNPSTADHIEDDNTSTVCINYAKQWGYGGVVMANLFAIRSTDKSIIQAVSDPIGPKNNEHIARLSREAVKTVCAWGDAGAYKGRDNEVLVMLQNPMCLVHLKSGRPGHPLYKSKDLVPIPYMHIPIPIPDQIDR